MFASYLDPALTLAQRLAITMDELSISVEQREAVASVLAPLKSKDIATYEHSIRVALLARRIARYMRLDEKALFYAGMLHDAGKCQVPLTTLTKTDGWTEADALGMRDHVMDGFRMLRDRFDFTAEVILHHHRFQPRGYPTELPEHLHQYTQSTRALILTYARVLALADVFDALHRVNSKHGVPDVPTGGQIKERMLACTEDDKKPLVEELYEAGIFTTYLVGASSQQAEADDELYRQVWDEESTVRTSEDAARHVMIASALEPVADKAGCTTRLRNISSHLRLEYFIVGGINIGSAFGALARRVLRTGSYTVLYDLALRAQKDSVRNRGGGRINQGIIELLVPVVAAQFRFDRDRLLTPVDVLARTASVLRSTNKADIAYLRQMKRFAYDLSRYTDRAVPEYDSALSVYDYYLYELRESSNPTSVAHNGEFINGYPTVRIAYKAVAGSALPRITARVEEAYTRTKAHHNTNVGSGFLADCIAVAIYLLLLHSPRLRIE